MTAGRLTEQLIAHQADAWHAAQASAAALPRGHTLLTGSGSSYYAALAAAEVGRRLGLGVAACPSAEVVTEPDVALGGFGTLVAVSRSGRTTEACLAAEAALDRGLSVVAATCHPDTPLAARASTVWAVPGGEDGTVVMLRSFTTLLVLLQSAMAKTAGAGLRWVDLLRGGFDAMLAASRAWSRVLEDDGRAPRRAVMLGGGVRYAIALEGMLKAAEMSNQPVEAYVPLEYRHGPWGSLTRGDAVILLGQRQAADWEARLLSDLRARTETLLVVGAEHSRPTDTAAGIWYSSDIPDLWAGPLAVVPLQVFAWTWAIMGGRDPDAPQNLSKVVDLDG